MLLSSSIVSRIITGSWSTAFKISLPLNILNNFLYYGHERLWVNIDVIKKSIKAYYIKIKNSL